MMVSIEVMVPLVQLALASNFDIYEQIYDVEALKKRRQNAKEEKMIVLSETN